MQKTISLRLLPQEALSEQVIYAHIAQVAGVSIDAITGFYITRQSVDARSRRQIWINCTIRAFIHEPVQQRIIKSIHFKDVSHATRKVIIVGAGPAGLFSALRLIEQGIQPVVLERGKDVRARRRDLALLNKEGIVNPESNYCFGEGGAGTYSDGKLYTRSNKRGNIDRILNLFVQFGADEKILYQSHPHIGTNKLPQIITSIREKITGCGGLFLFEKKVTDLIIDSSNTIKGVKTADGDVFHANAVILATGHSARDIFELLHSKSILVEAKPFALGVRIEHSQSLIDTIQYHLPQNNRETFLPPASYSLVEQVDGKGVFSFCMCPGGIIAPAATNPQELVVNGWSPSKRDNPYANSGIVVQVNPKDAWGYLSAQKKNIKESNPLLLMYFQQFVEQRAYITGGGKFIAPAQRMVDFCSGKLSNNLPACSYLPGVNSSLLHEVLPDFISHNLRKGFKIFGDKMKGYYTNDAIVVATESRTSSPVRIPRDADTLQHPQIKALYPCAEGAGYAGGIISAAMDGERVASAIGGSSLGAL